MKICQTHWEQLKQAITDRGLWHLVARSGKEAHENVVQDIQQGPSAETFDPLMSANFAIWSAGLKDGGLEMMVGDKCPLCEGEKSVPGLAADWINGASDDQLEIARHLGLVPKVQ